MTAIRPDMEELQEGDEPEDEVAEAEQPTDPSGLSGGWWLECEPKTAKRAVVEAVKSQASYRSYRRAYEDRNERVRAGERGLTIESSQSDQGMYRVRRGYESSELGVAPNILDELIERTAAVLTIDPPSPTVTGESDDPTKREASELAERFLVSEGLPTNRNDAAMLSSTINVAGTYGSAGRYFYLDPQGDGLQPVKVMAHPKATNTQDALAPMGPPQIGPNGEELPGVPLEIDEAEITWRYVRVDGTLTDIQAEARLTWQPKMMEVPVVPAQVTMFPFGATMEDATAVAVGRIVPLSELVSRYYDGERPTEEICRKLTEWAPSELDWKLWALPEQRALLTQDVRMRPTDRGEEPLISDDALCPILCYYMLSQGQAPFGVDICIGGLEEPIYRGEWRKTIGDGDTARIEAFPLPVAQFRCKDDPTGDPNGIAFVDPMLPESNTDDAVTRYMLEYMWRAGKPHTFLPVGGLVQPQAFKARTGDALVVNGQGVPTFEQVPVMDRQVGDYQKYNREGLQRASGLPATVASGQQDGSVTSGLQQRLVAEETRVGLAVPAQQRDRFIVTVWKLRLVFARAHYTTPRLLEYTGEAGDVQVRSFSGIELEGAGDIIIAKGSGTMLSPVAKMENAREELNLAMTMQNPEAIANWHDQLVSRQSTLMGLQDDPARARVARQVQMWKDAAKQADLPPAPPPLPPDQNQPPQVDPTTGAMVPPQPVAQPDPVAEQAARIFAPNPTDDMQEIAEIRYRVLRAAVASKAYETADARFQQAITAEFLRMKQAAGRTTIAEQQQAAQQQQQMQQQADMAKAQAASQAKIEQIDASKEKDPLPGSPGPALPSGPEAASAQNGPPPQGM